MTLVTTPHISKSEISGIKISLYEGFSDFSTTDPFALIKSRFTVRLPSNMAITISLFLASTSLHEIKHRSIREEEISGRIRVRSKRMNKASF